MGLKTLWNTLFAPSEPPPPPTGLAERIDTALSTVAVSVAKANVATDEFRRSVKAARARLNEA